MPPTLSRSPLVACFLLDTFLEANKISPTPSFVLTARLTMHLSLPVQPLSLILHARTGRESASGAEVEARQNRAQ